MATRRQLAQLRRALRFGQAERDELADHFTASKVEAYLDTLDDLAADYGYDLPADFALSDDVLRVLRQEAVDHAEKVVANFNTDADAFIARNADRPVPELLDTFDVWAGERADARAEQTAITEVYTAHADATIAFHQALGIDVEFDFGGHGDDDPVCEVCKALKDTSPHPADRVVKIGSPHIGCRQAWHPKLPKDAQLPDEVELGIHPAGIVGAEALVNRSGNDHDAAAAAVHQLATGE